MGLFIINTDFTARPRIPAHILLRDPKNRFSSFKNSAPLNILVTNSKPSCEMAETPNLAPPLDPREEPILDSLLELRDELTRLKQDRTTYVRSSDVMPLYEKVVDQVRLLNEIRVDKPTENNKGQPHLARHTDFC